MDNLFILPITNGHQFVYNLGSWFVAPLFMVEVFNVLFRKALCFINNNSKEYVYIVCTFLLGVLGIFLSCEGYNVNEWLMLVRFLYFLPFYSIGFFYKKKLEMHDNLPNTIYFFIVIFTQLIIIIVCGYAPTYEPVWCNFKEFNILPYIVGFLGIAFWLRISRIMAPVIGKSKTINLIAESTYSIMVNHIFGFMLVKSIFALGYKYTEILFKDFDWDAYHSNIWYFYKPKGLSQTLIIYVVISIIFAIAIQRVIDWLKQKILKKAKGNERIFVLVYMVISLFCGIGAWYISSLQSC